MVSPILFAPLLLALPVGAQTKASYGKYPPPLAPFSNDNLPSEVVVIPMTFPLIGKAVYRDSYNDQRGGFKHTGIDIKAPKMTPIVAPFSGRFGFKVHTFWIYRDNGWRCLGTHLNDDAPGTNDGSNNPDLMFAPNLRHGDLVEEGQLIGYVGNSGDATAPHLHFEIFGPDGIRGAYASLKKAKVITSPVPSSSVGFARPEKGVERFDLCLRRYTPSDRRLTGILVTKQTATGSTVAVTAPATKAFTVPSDLAATIQPDTWPTDRPFAVYVRGDIVTKIIAPTP